MTAKKAFWGMLFTHIFTAIATVLFAYLASLFAVFWLIGGALAFCFLLPSCYLSTRVYLEKKDEAKALEALEGI